MNELFDFIISLLCRLTGRSPRPDISAQKGKETRQSDFSGATEEKKKSNLVVAISARHPVVSSLKSKSESILSAEDGSALYEACRYLGRQNGIPLASLRDKHLSENSEYDIYLVKIDLKQWDERFDQNVNPMDRRDAFCELAGARFELSDRLSVGVYHALELYNR